MKGGDNISNIYKIYRLKAGYKLDEAVEKLSIGIHMLYKIEEGTRNPSEKTAEEMAKLYNCNLNDLLPKK